MLQKRNSASAARFTLGDLPRELRERVTLFLHSYHEAVSEAGLRQSLSPDLIKVLFRVWACSDFVAQSCIRHPDMLEELLRSSDLIIDYAEDDYRRRVEDAANDAQSEDELGELLSRLHLRETLRIAWRDLAGWADLDEIMGDLSRLADAIVNLAVNQLDKWQAAEWGMPIGAESGKRQSMVVVAMGKLGAYELNFCSDIDLIFTFPEDGETRGGAWQRSNEEYFIRLGQRLINLLEKSGINGKIYRVDMRLRPFGKSGPLAMSYDALEGYYQTHGRQWERYAMIKARPITGPAAARNQLMRLLRPFTYRRYLDFGAFEELRTMKEMIAREVQRKAMQGNIKLGAGGIREIEFIGQVFQLLRGGREPELRQTSIQQVLSHLGRKGYVADYACRELLSAYRFLRSVENHMQAFRGEQIHVLPDDDGERLSLAVSMGFASWHDFEVILNRHMAQVQSHFEQLITIPQAQTTGMDADGAALTAIWQRSCEAGEAEKHLARLGFDQPRAVSQLLEQLRDSSSVRLMTGEARQRLDQLMPLVLSALAYKRAGHNVLQHIVRLLETIARRPTYLVLLVENTMALSQLVKLCSASQWIAEQIIRMPLLLDELLDPRVLYTPLDRAGLEAAATSELQAVADDLEAQMEGLRHFKLAQILRVAAADVTGVYPLMEVSDHLTEIAEVCLSQVLRIAWEHLVERHGRPTCRVGNRKQFPGFAIIGYGKLGGEELGYGSDLDLVFLHSSRGDKEVTEGPAVIENSLFFSRLGQRIIHIVNTHPPAGVLYELDMRLRPSGTSGLLVSSLESYAEYQRNDAWTWEHQALVRARPVAGDQAVTKAFLEIRRGIVTRSRNEQALRDQVRDMRDKIVAERGVKHGDRFNLKVDPGGITDIEFIVQFCILRWSHEFPQLVEWSDNIRLLAALADVGILSQSDAQTLSNAYRSYRSKVHHLALQEQPAIVGAREFNSERRFVGKIWARLFGTH